MERNSSEVMKPWRGAGAGVERGRAPPAHARAPTHPPARPRTHLSPPVQRPKPLVQRLNLLLLDCGRARGTTIGKLASPTPRARPTPHSHAPLLYATSSSTSHCVSPKLIDCPMAACCAHRGAAGTAWHCCVRLPMRGEAVGQQESARPFSARGHWASPPSVQGGRARRALPHRSHVLHRACTPPGAQGGRGWLPSPQ